MVNIFKEVFQRVDDPASNCCIRPLLEEHNFQLRIKKLKRVRRITLRVCQIDRELKVTTPLNLGTVSVERFIEQHLKWIKTQILNCPPQVLISDGVELPLFGKNVTVQRTSDCKTKYCLSDKRLTVPKTSSDFKNQIKMVLINLAKEFFSEQCYKYSKELGVTFSEISMRDPKSRWGSCSSEKKLMFSWRLIMAPKEVSCYVAAHEVAHLVHMNHSKNFWEVVRSIYPDQRPQRNWLRQNGKKLHKFIF